MLRKVIAIDMQYAQRAAQAVSFQHFPIDEFRDLVSRGNRGSEGGTVPDVDVDVIETIVTVVKKVAQDDSAEAIATVASQVERAQYALEMKGCRVIVCPAKRTPDGSYKQSDDQRLMITTLSTCLKLRPDFLVFVGADGDYAPMLWELRTEGVRTEVAAVREGLASDLMRVAYNIIDLAAVFEHIKRNNQRARR